MRFRTPQQEHTFGFPYQLGHQVNADRPHDAMLAAVPVQLPPPLPPPRHTGGRAERLSILPKM